MATRHRATCGHCGNAVVGELVNYDLDLPWHTGMRWVHVDCRHNTHAIYSTR